MRLKIFSKVDEKLLTMIRWLKILMFSLCGLCGLRKGYRSGFFTTSTQNTEYQLPNQRPQRPHNENIKILVPLIILSHFSSICDHIFNVIKGQKICNFLKKAKTFSLAGFPSKHDLWWKFYPNSIFRFSFITVLLLEFAKMDMCPKVKHLDGYVKFYSLII